MVGTFNAVVAPERVYSCEENSCSGQSKQTVHCASELSEVFRFTIILILYVLCYLRFKDNFEHQVAKIQISDDDFFKQDVETLSVRIEYQGGKFLGTF